MMHKPLSRKAHASLDYGLMATLMAPRALRIGTIASLVAGYVLTDWDVDD